MSVQANGTDAKDIAIHFYKAQEMPVPKSLAKTINQAKTLLSKGYSKEEIAMTISYLHHIGKNMYSLGYVIASIDEVLPKAKKVLEDVRVKEIVMEGMQEEARQKRNEVIHDGESSKRNRDKSTRFGVQSRFGEKFNLDLFER